MTAATATSGAALRDSRRTDSLFQSRSETRLMCRYRHDGDLGAREALTLRFMPLARELARRYVNTGEPLDDLAQVAYIGLLKGIDRFDPNRGVRFTSYVVPTILGELKRHVRDRGWAVHMPRGLQERVLLMNRESEALTKALRRSPSVRELALELGWSAEELLEVRDAAGAYAAESLDARFDVPGFESGLRLVETLGSEDERYELVDSRDALASAWHKLPDRERRVVALRFGEELTQSEIGERMGCSQMQVSRLLRHALERMREAA
jgi:RNA polymerase sigma-B factor